MHRFEGGKESEGKENWALLVAVIGVMKGNWIEDCFL